MCWAEGLSYLRGLRSAFWWAVLLGREGRSSGGLCLRWRFSVCAGCLTTVGGGFPSGGGGRDEVMVVSLRWRFLCVLGI